MASAWSQLDQLLTCAICLDRYRNPKLLPCQHTFCMEPCLEGLIDYARRQIKCPECRAEHRIPYQGIQQFPTNVTLMRFLELHRDITGEEPEPPPSMMERCSVCSEKSNVEKCAHCEKKICPDCKEAHVDILRREINRINNQVRRGLHRLSEALSQTKKNAEKLQFNCTQVKDEIEDIVRRYAKDLRVTEEKLKRDLEVYTQTEMKTINKLKEDLEVEVSNISSNCDLVDKYIKDDSEWSDMELLEYKQVFLKMLDFLRTFDTDNADFARRIKFQPRADPDVLHRNIADFGELKINAPMNPIPTQQSLMPNALMRSQSDHRLASQFARRCDNRSFSDVNQRLDSDRDGGRPTSPLLSRSRRDGEYRRYSERSRDHDYQERVSSRYSREDTLSSRWRDGDSDYGHRNRYQRDYEDGDSEPHQGRTVRFADEPQQRERIFDLDDATRGPLSGVVRLLDSPKVMERLHQNEVRQKQQSEKPKDTTPTSPTVAPAPTVTPPASQPVPAPRRQTSRQQSEDEIDRQKRANQQASTSNAVQNEQPQPPPRASKTSPEQPARVSETSEDTPAEAPESNRSRRRASTTEETTTTTPSTPPETTTRIPTRFSRTSLVKAASLDSGGEVSRKPLDKKVPPRAATPIAMPEDANSNDDDEEDDEYETAEEPPKQSSFFSRQRRLPAPEPRLLEMHEDGSEESSESESEEEEEDESEEEQGATAGAERPEVATTSTQDKKDDDASEESDDEDEDEESSSESESEEEPRGQTLDNERAVVNGHGSTKAQTSSESEEESEEESESSENAQENGIDGSKSTKTAPEPTRKRPSVTIHETNGHRSRKRSEEADTTDSSSTSSSANYHSLSRNATPLVTSNTAAAAEERVSSEGSSSNDSGGARFRRRPFLARSKSSHEIGLGFEAPPDPEDDEEEEEDSPAPAPTYRTRAPDNSRVRSSSIIPSTNSNSCWANYLKNKYGSNATGRVVPRSRSSHSLYQRSDSESSEDEVQSGRDPVLSGSYGFSNPRSTYMQKRRMIFKIGSRGTEPGNFTWPRGVAVGPDNSIVVADSSNHRVQVFDAIGKFLYEFGAYGSGDGDFDCLAGVCVNRIGQFIVSDRYNHRVQLFDPTGRFLRAFGCEGKTDGRFNYPWGIATDSLGFIYVCDKENHRIQVFQSDGTFVGKFGSLGSRPGQVEHPHYVAVTNTNRVVVTDTNNHRVQIFDVNGRSLTTFGTEGSEEGHFKFPRGVAVDDQGYIIVGDGGNNRIQIFQPDGTFLRAFGTWGAANGEFKGLEGLAVTTGGSIIACDRENHRIQVF